MHKWGSCLGLAVLVGWIADPSISCASSADFPRLTHLEAVMLHDGVNPVPAMTADGRAGMIVMGHKNYITAGGAHDVFLVLTQNRPPDGGWSVVTAGTLGLQLPTGYLGPAASEKCGGN